MKPLHEMKLRGLKVDWSRAIGKPAFIVSDAPAGRWVPGMRQLCVSGVSGVSEVGCATRVGRAFCPWEEEGGDSGREKTDLGAESHEKSQIIAKKRSEF